MEVFTDAQLASWAIPVPDSVQQITSVSESLNSAVAVVQAKLGPVKLLLHGSYARSTAVPGSDVDYLLYRCDVTGSADTVWGDPVQRQYESFRNETEDALRDWNGGADAHRAIWTRVEGLEVHLLPVLPYRSPSGDDGAWFWWGSGVAPTVTYPELVTARILERDAAVNGRYCEVVRVFKNLRERMSHESDNMPGSSLLESLVYVADQQYLSPVLSLRDCCVGVLEDLRTRLADEGALVITEPSGYSRLFDDVDHDPGYDEATTFVDEALRALS